MYVKYRPFSILVWLFLKVSVTAFQLETIKFVKKLWQVRNSGILQCLAVKHLSPLLLCEGERRVCEEGRGVCVNPLADERTGDEADMQQRVLHLQQGSSND